MSPSPCKHVSLPLGVASSRSAHADDTYDEGDEPLSELKGVVQLPGRMYSLSLPIPAVFFRYIIGSKGSTRENIERDTQCRLTIPRRGEEGDISELEVKQVRCSAVALG